MQVFCTGKYNGHLLPEHELKKTTSFLIRNWNKEHLIFGKENKLIIPKNWEPIKIQRWESTELLPLGTPTPNRH